MSTILNDTSAIKVSTLFSVAGNDAAKVAERQHASPKSGGAGEPAVDIKISDHGRLNLHGTSGVQPENAAAKGQVGDAGIADELINLTKSQILNQSGASPLGSANSNASALLGLLKPGTFSVQLENATVKNPVRDADVANELINLTKSQILNQSGVSPLGSANSNASTLLGLLKSGTSDIQSESATVKNPVRDADVADELVNLTKSQILNQSGASPLVSANRDAQTILNLLR